MTRTIDSDIPFTPPMDCLPVASLPDASGWVYELKFDGFRGQGIRDKSGVHLLSRNGKDLSKRFPQVCAALKEAMPPGTAVDGELVAFDESGHTRLPRVPNAIIPRGHLQTVPSRCALGRNSRSSPSLLSAPSVANCGYW